MEVAFERGRDILGTGLALIEQRRAGDREGGAGGRQGFDELTSGGHVGSLMRLRASVRLRLEAATAGPALGLQIRAGTGGALIDLAQFAVSGIVACVQIALITR